MERHIRPEVERVEAEVKARIDFRLKAIPCRRSILAIGRKMNASTSLENSGGGLWDSIDADTVPLFAVTRAALIPARG